MAKAAEFVLNPALTQIVVVEPHGPPSARILERYREDPAVQLCECANSSEAISVVRQMASCLVFIHARNPQDFVQHSLILKGLQSQIRKKTVRVILTTSIKSADMLAKFSAAGCSEVLPETLGAKQMQFKVDRLLKSLPRVKAAQAAAPGEVAEKSAAKAKRAGAAAAGEGADQREAGTVKLEKPLDIKGDCWVMQGGSAKRVAGRWLMRFHGPMPDQGKWVPAPSGVVPGAQGDIWEWKPAYPEGVPFALDEGIWYFAGQRPDFQSDFWIFVSRAPVLTFFSAGREIGFKARINDKGSLVVAKDSKLSTQLVEFLHKSRTAARKKANKAVEDEARRERERKREAEAAAGGKLQTDGESFEVEEDDPSAPAGAAPGSPGTAGAAGAKKRRRKVEVTYVPALALAKDHWLLELHKPRMAGGRWVIELQGPTLQDGSWVDRSPSAEAGADHLWQWVPDEKNSAATPGAPAAPEAKPAASEGDWIYTGIQPRYSNGVWTFTGARPSLVFRRGEERVGAKFETLESGSLQCARDSEGALRAFEAALAERKRRKATGEEEDEASVLKSKAAAEEGAGAETTFGAGDGAAGREFGEGEGPAAAAAPAAEAEGGMEFGGAVDENLPEHRFPLAHFGDARGKWEHVTAMATGGRMYAFVPRALKEGDVKDLRAPQAFGAYWTYVGPSAPRKADAEWVFLANEPESFKNFDGLAPPAQAYFRGMVGDDFVQRAAELGESDDYRGRDAAPESPELEATASTADSPVMEVQLEPPPALGKEMSATQEAPATGPMLEATQAGAGPGQEMSATQEGAGPGQEMSATQEASAPGPELEATQDGAGPGKALEAIQAAPPAGPELEAPPPSEARPPALTGPLVPKGIKLRPGADPAAPLISPLALAFLVSELMRKRDLDHKEIGRRYCAYVSSSCAGLRTEIWVARGGAAAPQWECAATVDGGPGRCRPAIEAGEGLRTVEDEPVWIAPLRSETGQLIGALAIGGRGADRMKQEYAKASAQMAYGLMLAFQEAA